MTLRSFRFENHRSFAGEAEFSLEPAFGKRDAPLTVAAIYGANAAGKSNLIDAIDFMCRAVRDSYRNWEPESGVPRRPFKLGQTAKESTSTFVAELVLLGTRYVYGFILDDLNVLEEWLYSYPKARRRVLFERRGVDIKFGSTVEGAQGRSEVLAGLTRSNALFLSVAAQSGLEETRNVWRWFAGTADGSRASGMPTANQRSIIRVLDGPQGARLRDLIRLADFGIVDVVIDFDEPTRPIETLWQPFSLMTSAPGALDSETVLRELLEGRRGPGGARLLFDHGNPTSLFELRDESTGTRSWIALLPAVIDILEQGATFLVDEIDTSLHPHLIAALVNLFQSPDTNPKGAQLIFTTHDATLLGTSYGEELLRRDQIWFVEKDAQGASQLIALTDFHPRKGENREKRYLGGSYGAVPVIPTAAELGEGRQHAS